jgi:hypothetical protein
MKIKVIDFIKLFLLLIFIIIYGYYVLILWLEMVLSKNKMTDQIERKVNK